MTASLGLQAQESPPLNAWGPGGAAVALVPPAPRKCPAHRGARRVFTELRDCLSAPPTVTEDGFLGGG